MRAWASSGSSELQVPTVGTLLMSRSGIRRVLQRFLHKWCIGRSFRVGLGIRAELIVHVDGSKPAVLIAARHSPSKTPYA